MSTIYDIAHQVATKLNIDVTQLIDIIKEKEKIIDLNIINDNLLKKIQKLIKTDEDINNFGKTIDDDVKQNFNMLKQNLGKLQLLVLLKNLEKSKNSSDILNSFIKIFNNKINVVNNIL